jgi:hypothetical protein
MFFYLGSGLCKSQSVSFLVSSDSVILSFFSSLRRSFKNLYRSLFQRSMSRCSLSASRLFLPSGVDLKAPTTKDKKTIISRSASSLFMVGWGLGGYGGVVGFYFFDGT